jgi:hypothetical protein
MEERCVLLIYQYHLLSLTFSLGFSRLTTAENYDTSGSARLESVFGFENKFWMLSECLYILYLLSTNNVLKKFHYGLLNGKRV